MVTLLGDLGAQKIPLNPRGERILDVIARAGGTKYPGYEMFVMLQRGKQKGVVAFNRLFEAPEENIFVQPGDTLYVFRQAPTFLVFGATSTKVRCSLRKKI